MFDQFLTDRVTIRRAGGRAVSTTGAATETWNTVKANVAASVQQRSTSHQQREAGYKDATQWKGYFHGNEDIRVNDEVVTAAGKKYKARSVYSLGAHQEVELIPHEE